MIITAYERYIDYSSRTDVDQSQASFKDSIKQVNTETENIWSNRIIQQEGIFIK